jgi:tetratricopeptide (TPR) repeat protein
VATFLPGKSVFGFSAQEKILYVDALLNEWRGFLFAGDIDSADAYASQFRSDSQFLALSADQQLQAATLDLRTTLISGKAVSRERQEEFAKGIEKSIQPSMNASADIAQLTLIEAYVRDGRLFDANDRLDRVMVRVQADQVTSGSPAGIVQRMLADTAMLVGRFGDSRVALQGYQKVQDELPMCHNHLEYWLSQAELTLNEGLAMQAEFSISQAAQCFEFKKTLDHFQFARMKNTEGLLHVLMERPTEALTAFDVAASIWRKRLGEQHFWLGQAYNNKGAALRIKGDLPLAGQEFEKSASLWRDVLGESHLVMATFYNNIAELEMRQGGLGKAQETFFNAYAIRRQAFGDDHPWTAVVISNLGEVASLAGAYEQALKWHVKALSIRTKTLGNVHPDTALSQNNLGSILFRTGETQRALSAFREALTINQKLLGEEHPRTMAVQANLAASQVALEDYAGAEGTLVRLAELETIRGIEARLSLAMVLVRLGDVRLKLGLLSDAEVVYLAALDTMNQMESERRSPDVARQALTGLGSVQNQFGKSRVREKVESQYPWLRDIR